MDYTCVNQLIQLNSFWASGSFSVQKSVCNNIVYDIDKFFKYSNPKKSILPEIDEEEKGENKTVEGSIEEEQCREARPRFNKLKTSNKKKSKNPEFKVWRKRKKKHMLKAWRFETKSIERRCISTLQQRRLRWRISKQFVSLTETICFRHICFSNIMIDSWN